MRKSLSLLKWLFKEFQKNFLPTKNAGGPRTSRVFVVQRYSRCIQNNLVPNLSPLGRGPYTRREGIANQMDESPVERSHFRTFARSIDIDEKFPNGVRHHSRSFHEELMSGAGHAAVLRISEARLHAHGS